MPIFVESFVIWLTSLAILRDFRFAFAGMGVTTRRTETVYYFAILRLVELIFYFSPQKHAIDF